MRITGQLYLPLVLLKVSKNKQILLFLLDDEYTKPVQDLFEANNVIEYNLIESESEKDLTIKRV